MGVIHTGAGTDIDLPTLENKVWFESFYCS